MNSRAWIVIVFLGVGSVGAMGMIAKFAFESDPGLKQLLLFKQSLADAFSSRGVQEVSVRRDKRARSYQVILTCRLPGDEKARARLDSEIADFFVREHKDTSANALKISYLFDSAWGCSSRSSDPQRVVDVPLQPIRVRIKRDQREMRLGAALEKSLACTLVASEWSANRELRVDIAVPTAEDDADLARFAKEIEKAVRLQLRGFYTKLHLRLVARDTEELTEKLTEAKLTEAVESSEFSGQKRGDEDGGVGSAATDGTTDGTRGRTPDGSVEETPAGEETIEPILFETHYNSRGMRIDDSR